MVTIKEGKPPYSNRSTRWILPVMLSLVIAFDITNGLAALASLVLICVYLPRTFWAEKLLPYRKERLIRSGIYLAGIAYAAGAFYYTSGLAMERAELIIAAAENYKAANGQYPNSLKELVPLFIPEIPEVARINRFGYYAGQNGHVLFYMNFPPSDVKEYVFENKKWRHTD